MKLIHRPAISTIWVFAGVLLAFCFLTPTDLAFGDVYEVTVTRKTKDIYKISSGGIVQTRYCYEYAYSASSLLDVQPYGGKLFFRDSGQSCDVRAIFLSSTIPSGAYEIVISGDGEFYVGDFENVLFESSLCLEIAMMDNAIYRSSGAYGQLIFSSGSSCNVEQVYTKSR